VQLDPPSRAKAIADRGELAQPRGVGGEPTAAFGTPAEHDGIGGIAFAAHDRVALDGGWILGVEFLEHSPQWVPAATRSTYSEGGQPTKTAAWSMNALAFVRRGGRSAIRQLTLSMASSARRLLRRGSTAGATTANLAPSTRSFADRVLDQEVAMADLVPAAPRVPEDLRRPLRSQDATKFARPTPWRVGRASPPAWVPPASCRRTGAMYQSDHRHRGHWCIKLARRPPRSAPDAATGAKASMWATCLGAPAEIK
jgi:hypothetical protein